MTENRETAAPAGKDLAAQLVGEREALKKEIRTAAEPARKKGCELQLERVEKQLFILRAAAARVRPEAEPNRYAQLSALSQETEVSRTRRMDSYQAEMSSMPAGLAAQKGMNEVRSWSAERMAGIAEKAMACLQQGQPDLALDLVRRVPEGQLSRLPILYTLMGLALSDPACEGRDEKKAFQCFQKAVQAGELKMAAELLGTCYRWGAGTAPDRQKALRWLEMASENGLTAAPEQALAEMALENEDLQGAFDWLQLGWYEHQDHRCRIFLAALLLEKNLGPFYEEKALNLLWNAFADGQRAAWSLLMGFYTDRCLKEDIGLSKIRVLLEVASANKWLDGCAMVAECYARGYGTEQDPEAALQWYRQADARGEVYDRTVRERTEQELERRRLLEKMREKPFTAADAAKAVAGVRGGVLEIPEGFTCLQGNAFDSFRGTGLFHPCRFKELRLPDSILGVGAEALRDLKGLRRVNVPRNLVSLGQGAFRCQAETGDIVLSGLLRSVPRAAFAGVKAGSIVLEEGITELGSAAFAGVQAGLLTLPDSLSVVIQGREAEDDTGDTFRGAVLDSVSLPARLEQRIRTQKNITLAGAVTVTDGEEAK